MSQDITVIPPGAPVEAYEETYVPVPSSRSLAPHVNAGTVAVEQERAIAEVQGEILVAQRCPRNIPLVGEEIIRACQEFTLAEEAFYKFDRGGQMVTGGSIRLAEECARVWGNIEYGIRELSQREGVSEMEAYAWDKQTNARTKQTFTVRHVRDTKSGLKPLTSTRDIYELTANMGGRRLRSRIFALLPKWYVALAEAECRKTLSKGDGTKTISERARAMVAAFIPLGVNTQQIEKKIGKPLTNITGDDLVDLLATYHGIKDGVSSVAEQFGGESTSIAAAVTAASTASPTTSTAAATTKPKTVKETPAVAKETPTATIAADPKPTPPEPKTSAPAPAAVF